MINTPVRSLVNKFQLILEQFIQLKEIMLPALSDSSSPADIMTGSIPIA